MVPIVETEIELFYFPIRFCYASKAFYISSSNKFPRVFYTPAIDAASCGYKGQNNRLGQFWPSNRLECLPASFGNLESLKYLYLNEAKTTLPKSFGWLTNLKQLHIDSSLYKTVLGKYGSLRTVSLKEKEIKNFLAVFQKESIESRHEKYRLHVLFLYPIIFQMM